jgi:hypothetical protein
MTQASTWLWIVMKGKRMTEWSCESDILYVWNMAVPIQKQFLVTDLTLHKCVFVISWSEGNWILKLMAVIISSFFQFCYGCWVVDAESRKPRVENCEEEGGPWGYNNYWSRQDPRSASHQERLGSQRLVASIIYAISSRSSVSFNLVPDLNIKHILPSSWLLVLSKPLTLDLM